MLYPSLEEVRSYVGQYDQVPVVCERYTDLYTPIGILCKMREESDSYFLLESMEGDRRVSRYSFVGYKPKCVLENKEGKNPFQLLREKVKAQRIVQIEGLPPFHGGGVGYIGYEAVQYTKPVQCTNEKDIKIPEMLMMFFEELFIFDHEKQTLYVVAMMKLEEESVDEAYSEAVQRIEALEALLEKPYTVQKEETRPITFEESEPKEAYMKKVETIQDYIKAGDIFQAVLSTKFYFETEGDLISIYRALRVINPSPYMFMIRCKDLQLVGASPETLVKVQEQKVTTMPIAGTKKRGKDAKEDKVQEEILRQDPKENAEHCMLVDLARNDVGAISTFGTVEVSKYKEIQKFSHVMHMTSEVQGSLRDGCDGISALESILPAGTLSGAPKIRAMEIIDELECYRRGVYGGAIGYIGYDGNVDTCIAIRTIVKKGKKGILQAGAGIVLDSVPETEYEEVVSKLHALSTAIKKVGDVK